MPIPNYQLACSIITLTLFATLGLGAAEAVLMRAEVPAVGKTDASSML